MDRFKDRRDAGRRLAGALQTYDGTDAIVLALPRGGVPVGYEVAKALRLELDVLVVRKIGAPQQPELAVGAVGQGGVRVVNEDLRRRVGMDERRLAEAANQKETEVEERVRMFRGDRPLPDVAGRTAILVDNGVATGSTMLAGARVLCGMDPARVVLAAPILSPRVLEQFEDEADEVAYLLCPEDLQAVGQWYEDFTQTSDKEVIRLLEKAREVVH